MAVFVGVVVGPVVGAVVGPVVGTVVGGVVGPPVVGTVVGTVVGPVVGTVVGPVVGTVVGPVVGTVLGRVVGTVVAAVVGTVVGPVGVCVARCWSRSPLLFWRGAAGAISGLTQRYASAYSGNTIISMAASSISSSTHVQRAGPRPGFLREVRKRCIQFLPVLPDYERGDGFDSTRSATTTRR